jgi:hypothetical protein
MNSNEAAISCGFEDEDDDDDDGVDDDDKVIFSNSLLIAGRFTSFTLLPFNVLTSIFPRFGVSNRIIHATAAAVRGFTHFSSGALARRGLWRSREATN